MELIKHMGTVSGHSVDIVKVSPHPSLGPSFYRVVCSECGVWDSGSVSQELAESSARVHIRKLATAKVHTSKPSTQVHCTACDGTGCAYGDCEPIHFGELPPVCKVCNGYGKVEKSSYGKPLPH